MNKPVKTALLSYGMSGYVFHGPLLSAHPGFEIAAVFHRSHKPVAHRFPVVYDMKDILNDDSIELVIVNTPNEKHYEHAEMALNAGKHVIVEKPFTVTKSEAAKLIELAKQRGRLLTVFQNRRWDGDFLTVQDIVAKGLVGRIVEFECHYDRYRDVVDEASWKEVKSRGTGVIYNLGSHMIDQVLTLFGRPKFVDARVGIQRQGAVVDDYYDIRLEYDDMQAIVKSSYLVREPGPRYMLHGEKGSFVKYGLDPQEQDLKDGKTPGAAGWGKEPEQWWGKLNTDFEGQHIERKIETLPGNYLAFYDNVYAVLGGDAGLIVKPEQAMEVIEVIEAALESSRLKRAIPLS